MKVNERQAIDKLGLEVTRMGFGGAPFGNLFEAIPEEDVADCLAAAYGAGIRYFDTAPLYGFGLSESRYGTHLAQVTGQLAEHLAGLGAPHQHGAIGRARDHMQSVRVKRY